MDWRFKRDSVDTLNMGTYSMIDDLTHMVGPLTEESIVKCLQARFYSQLYQTKVGPVTLILNPYQYNPVSNVLTDGNSAGNILQKVVHDVITCYTETGRSQIIVLSGENGSGKTHCSLQLLRQLFDMVGGGPETDTFKHLSATLTILRSLGTAATAGNQESTRVGFFIESIISDDAICKSKVHCYFLDRERVTNVQRFERNYHIFYQMLAGLSQNEKAKLHLTNYSSHNLRYLSYGLPVQNEIQDRKRFDAWKAALFVLGIPFSDITRILTAVLLLGNIEFIEGQGAELEVIGNNELKAVAALLGVSGVALYRAFTTRTVCTHGQVCRSIADASMANSTRDALAKSLYCRSVTAIIRRANTLKKPSSNSTLSSSSLNSLDLSTSHDAFDFSSSRLSLNSSQYSQSGSSWNESKSSEGCIGILDMYGFEVAEVNQVEQLCINLCAETIQHYYNTHNFRSAIEALRDENIKSDFDLLYFDNSPVIELISSQTNGLLSVMDSECANPRGSSESYVEKIKMHHNINNFFFEPLPKTVGTFGIRHFAGRVVYHAADFIRNNRDQINDDAVHIFNKSSCNFGFVTHLFSQELKYISDSGYGGPQGIRFRILPRSRTEKFSFNNRGTLAQDFQNKLDGLLKNLMHAKPHFVRCIKKKETRLCALQTLKWIRHKAESLSLIGSSHVDKFHSNDKGAMGVFDTETVIRQIRSLQVLETVKLMAGGYPHRMRYKSFLSRYKLFLRSRAAFRVDNYQEECKVILDSFLKLLEESKRPYVSTQWALGKKHLFYSETTRQQLEAMREERLTMAATKIQAGCRGWRARKLWPVLRVKLEEERQYRVLNMKQRRNSHNGNVKYRIERANSLLLEKAYTKFNINPNVPPPLPCHRNYFISNGMKINYPNTRIMKETYPGNGDETDCLFKGEEVRVLGVSKKKGHLAVEKRNLIIDVPYSLLDVKHSSGDAALCI